MPQAASADRWRGERGRNRGRGRSAERPRDIPAQGWKDVLWRVKDQIGEDRLSIVAAGVAFYALLAVFPALAALISIYGLMFDPQQVTQQLKALEGVFPPQAMEVLIGQLKSLAQANQTALGFGAVVGLLLTLWSASAGMKTLMEALNVAYDENETRGFVKRSLMGLALTLGAILGAVLAIGVVVVLPTVLKFIGLGSTAETLIGWLRWPILAAVVIVGFGIVYRYGPARDKPRWQWVSWGAVIGTLLWLIGSGLFSWYVSNFGNYNETYGSVAAIVILMLWFLLSAYAILIGAEINAELERQTKKDTTDGPREPIGRRGAYAADTVGEARAPSKGPSKGSEQKP